MGTTSPFKDQQHPQHCSHHRRIFTKKLIPWILYALLPIALLRLYFHPSPLLQSSPHQLPHPNILISSTTSDPSSPPPPPPLPPPPPSSPPLPPPSPPLLPSPSLKESERRRQRGSSNIGDYECEEYSKGKWVRDEAGPIYNGSSCGTIKDGQNCLAHGRPDLNYLFYRWKPHACPTPVPRFQPHAFLRLLRHKHLAFVGDSMARNQLESLLCMLSTISYPKLLYHSGEDNKFRRWLFASHNLTVSVYWSPFLVKGTEKSADQNYNQLYLDEVDERWASDLDRIDVVLVSVGHWFLHPAVYYEGGRVLGCHYCPGMNHSEIGFYGVFGKALRTTLRALIDNNSNRRRRGGMDAVVTTFSPAHFEGEWDKAGACPKTAPYREGEKAVEGMDYEMWRVEVAEVKSAAAAAKKKREYGGSGLRVEALDVTEMAMMRADGHPGPYMNPFPFADGVHKDRVQNDCVHWCLPGPIDTWNEILLHLVKRWRRAPPTKSTP